MNIKKLVVEFSTVFAVALVTVARHNLRQEPSAVILHARICEGGWLVKAILLDIRPLPKWLIDELYPQDEQVSVMLDNLATHKPAALYETFPPQEARRILKKLEFHNTPKHESWLNTAEIELSIFRKTMKNYLPVEQAFA